MHDMLEIPSDRQQINVGLTSALIALTCVAFVASGLHLRGSAQSAPQAAVATAAHQAGPVTRVAATGIEAAGTERARIVMPRPWVLTLSSFHLPLICLTCAERILEPQH